MIDGVHYEELGPVGGVVLVVVAVALDVLVLAGVSLLMRRLSR